MKTSLVSCENQSFFLLYQNMVTFIESHCIFHCFFFFSIFQYLVYMDPVSGYSKSRLLVKKHVSLKVKSDWAMYVSCNFCYPGFLLWSIFSPSVDVQLKWPNPLCWAYPRLIFFRVKWWQNIGKTMSVSISQIKWCKLASAVSFLHERGRKTILRAWKSVHTNTKFVEPC